MTGDAIGVRIRQWALNFGIRWMAATAIFVAAGGCRRYRDRGSDADAADLPGHAFGVR